MYQLQEATLRSNIQHGACGTCLGRYTRHFSHYAHYDESIVI